MKNEDIEKIIAGVKQGDETAFRSLFNAYKNPVYAYALKFFRSSSLAEDVVQETFLKIWLNRANLDVGQSIQAYIYKIAQNTVFNSLKRAGYDDKLKFHLFHHKEQYHNPVEEDYLYRELQQLQQKAISLLPPQRQLIYRLSREEGLSHEKIALQLDISKNTVKDQIVKASKFIREYLKSNTEILLPVVALFTSLSACI